MGNETSTILCHCMGRVRAPFGRVLGAPGSSAGTNVLLALRSSGGSTLVRGRQGAQLAAASLVLVAPWQNCCPKHWGFSAGWAGDGAVAKVPAKHVSTTEGKPTGLVFIPNSQHLGQAASCSCLQQPQDLHDAVCWTATQASGILFFFLNLLFFLDINPDIQKSFQCRHSPREQQKMLLNNPPPAFTLPCAPSPSSTAASPRAERGWRCPSVRPSVRPSGLPVREGLLGPAKARWCLRAVPGPS